MESEKPYKRVEIIFVLVLCYEKSKFMPAHNNDIDAPANLIYINI